MKIPEEQKENIIIQAEEYLSKNPLPKGYSKENFIQAHIDNFIQFKIFAKQLKEESNRGMVLVGVSYIEYNLEAILTKALIGSSSHKKNLFNISGPLNTFSTKTSLAYSLGLITWDTFNDLNIIRKIRNELGHSWESVDFESQKMNNIINQLNNRDKFLYPNREALINKISHILGELSNQVLYVEEFKTIWKDSK